MERARVLPGVGIECERLVAVLERAVDAMELLATVPTPETSESFAAFLLDAHGGGGGELKADVVEILSAHFRLEASLAHHVSEPRQRQKSAQVSTIDKPSQEVERPEVEEDALEEEGEEEKEEEEEEKESEKAIITEPAEPNHSDHDEYDAHDFSRSLHDVLSLLMQDKATQNALRRLSATRVSATVALFVHGLTDLVMLCERSLATSPEQLVRQQRTLRHATQRLVELHDDAQQLTFELRTERNARQSHAVAQTQTITQLRKQLLETQRQYGETLQTTQRTREQDAQTLRTQYDSDRVGVAEKMVALARSETRVTDAHQAEEADDRRRVARAIVELQELLAKYDEDMAALDARIALEEQELRDQTADTTRLTLYFERVDEDRRYLLEELRARAMEDALRRLRELNLFKLTARLQALVRGFLTRRRIRLDEQLRKKQRRKKKKQQQQSKSTTTKRVSTSASTTTRRRPTRPSSASKGK